MRKGEVYVSDIFAGTICETDEGYSFQYESNYIDTCSVPVSLTMPVRKEPYSSRVLFPFFDGLIPEGWLLDVVTRNWKLDSGDRFGILLISCADPIGNVSIREVSDS